MYPMAVDESGAIYSVTGTAFSDDFIRVNTDNSVSVLNSNIGRIVGVISDMEIAYGGDLFVNYAQTPISASGSHGVLRLDRLTGAVTTFYSASNYNADGGIAFNSASSTLYMQSQLGNASLIALDSLGNATTVVENLGESRGLSLEASGTLITIGQTEVRRVDPITSNVTILRDIADEMPGFRLRAVDVLSTGEIAFTVQNEATATRFLYSINQDGSNLNLIASGDNWGPHQIKFGASRDGLGKSLYVNNPNSLDLYELRFTAVPEPSSVFMLTASAIAVYIRSRRRQQVT